MAKMGGRDMVHGKWNIIVSFGQTQIRGGKFQELEQMHLMHISHLILTFKNRATSQ
jgi:hypothetical protein